MLKWLSKLGIHGQQAIELAKKKPVQMIFAGEKKMLDILTPIFTSGKEISESQLANAIYDGMTSIRKDISTFYKDRYGKSFRNPAGSIADRNQSKLIAANYKNIIKDKLADYESKKELLSDLEYKADVISATQSAKATNDERDFILKKITKTKRWNATLDNTCKYCRNKNGTTISANKSFKPAAPAHPHCRCYYTYYDDKGKEVI